MYGQSKTKGRCWRTDPPREGVPPFLPVQWYTDAGALSNYLGRGAPAVTYEP